MFLCCNIKNYFYIRIKCVYTLFIKIVACFKSYFVEAFGQYYIFF